MNEPKPTTKPYTSVVGQKSNLLVFNFEMDQASRLLSHQREAVCALAEKFGTVTVISGRVGDNPTPSNVRTISTNWIPKQRARSIYRLLKAAVPIIIRGEFTSVFFHMTDLQCALLSPFIKLRGKRQFLWYAHTSKSIYLDFASRWVDAVITSTAGSCPITGDRVVPIGQAIDQHLFGMLKLHDLNLTKLIHIGRFDKSKRIDQLIARVVDIRREYPDVELTIVGSPGNRESKVWAEDLIRGCRENVQAGWLHFEVSIERSRFRAKMSQHGVFFHSYLGSLDKTLVESTMLGVPVVTINLEYTSIFGTWSGKTNANLVEEYKSLRALSMDSLQKEISRRRDIALSHHSLENWIRTLASMLG